MTDTAPAAASAPADPAPVDPAQAEPARALDAAPARRRPALYWRLWAGVPRELLALILSFVVASVVFTVSISLVSSAAGSLVTVVFAALLLIAAMYVARGSGFVELALQRLAGRPVIPAPDWTALAADGGSGFVGWLRGLFGNRHAWLYLLHTLVFFVVSLVTFVVSIVWASIALGGVTAWFWERFLPDGDRDFFLSQWLVTNWFGGGAIDGRTGDLVLQSIVGVIFLVTLPFVTRGLSWVNWGVDRGLLGVSRTRQLEQRLSDVSASRTAAVAAEGSALRRLERDIHDGPQQRLVRLQMDLAAADRAIEKDPAAARELVAQALQQSRDALEELRALSRGFAPPILLDRGLVAALESLAVRSPLPTTVRSNLPEGFEVPPELARNLYFIAAEALTNAAKHSGADAATVLVELRRVVDPDGTWIDLTVSDDGRGGAAPVAGHGLAGLTERAHGQGGELEVESPAGGGTRITARLPLTREV
ncbi:MAG: sensor histidine kinase [Actinomycetales bacterium]|nr:sensor histidine kinase [Actinomycetales bacterium]